MQIKGILFDFGYTLAEYRLPPGDANWEGLMTICLRSVERALGMSGEDRLLRVAQETLYRPANISHQEVPLAERLQKTFDAGGVTVPPGAIIELMKLFYKPINDCCHGYPDAEPALAVLKERGLKLGLVSNSPWGAPGTFGKQDVARTGLTDYFDTMLFSGDTRYRKPAPEIFQKALEALGLSADETLFVGDDVRRDIAGAKGVGMKTILRRVPNRGESTCGFADWEINECGDILQIIDGVSG